ncbi:MAG TPA: SDR family oxidoreductase [Mycobacterium sp.]|nr:SDR family oxidoreductase [Mycobacterium sp.]
MVNELAGKVAIVTGGASGIGRGIVERFVAEGARVVIADVETDKGEALAAALGADAFFRRTDVSDPEQVGALVSAAVEKFGGLHVMVNNAGISSKMHRRFLDDDLADFHRVMAVNVLGVMAGTRDAARYMAANGGGSIINMSSIGGIQAGGGVMIYRASKAAVIQFTKSAAIELAHYEIRVNAIAPGNIPTPILASSAVNMDQEQIERYGAAIRETMRADRPLKREGTPEDIAEAALYFATDRSRYVTGTVLPVDGGTSAGKAIRRRSESQKSD